MTTLYQTRVIDYCQRNGIVVPDNFCSTTAPERFVIIDESVSPPILMPRTTPFEKELLDWTNEARNAGRKIRLLDFKRCCELAIASDGKFRRFRSLDVFGSEERLQQDKLNQSDA